MEPKPQKAGDELDFLFSPFALSEKCSLTVRKIVGRPSLAEVLVGEFTCGRKVEFVDGMDPTLPKEEKWIINISTQFGCPVGCPFCDASSRYLGNLTAAQMMSQVRTVLHRNEESLPRTCRKLKVHFSRMGEPALNDAVLGALRQLRAELPWPGVWACVATTAPTGRRRWFDELFEIKESSFPGRFQLQFSVNSTDAEARKTLVPIPHWDLDGISTYGERFVRQHDRKVVLNFALGRNVPFDPGVIADRFDPDRFAVKITPINPTETGARNGFETVLRSDGEELLKSSLDELQQAGFDLILSVGDVEENEIGSNCGQALRLLADN